MSSHQKASTVPFFLSSCHPDLNSKKLVAGICVVSKKRLLNWLYSSSDNRVESMVVRWRPNAMSKFIISRLTNHARSVLFAFREYETGQSGDDCWQPLSTVTQFSFEFSQKYFWNLMEDFWIQQKILKEIGYHVKKKRTLSTWYARSSSIIIRL